MKRFAEFGLWGLVAILVGSWGMRWNASVGDSYPAHPVQIVVPYSAGGGTDNFARLLVQAIQQHELPACNLLTFQQSVRPRKDMMISDGDRMWRAIL